MPRNVRNFWIEARIDGRADALVGGPVGKEGGFDLTILMRDKGEVCTDGAIEILGRAFSDGTIRLRIKLPRREDVVYETVR